jgi:predicted helicase
MFLPQDISKLNEYMKGRKVTDVFPVNSIGIVTARDDLTIKWSKKEVENTINDFAALSPDEARYKYNLGEDARDWKIALAQKDLKDSGLSLEKIVQILYRPFDARYTYYTGHSRGFHRMPRGEVMRNTLLGPNLGLIARR